MKGILHWFKSSSKMKRWILLVLVGIVLTCYGIAKILVEKEMEFIDAGKIIVTFVIGFTCIVLGLVLLNKRNMELFIEATDDRLKHKKHVNVQSLIFDKKIYDRGPNIVVIGGGAGLNTVLSGLKKYTDNLTAIVTISDYGEGISESRKELQTMPLDDVKDSIVALSSDTKDGQLDKLFNYKFTDGKLRNLTFADIYFSAMKNINKDFSDSIIKSNEVLNIVGKVLPVTLDEMNITAELQNGYLVTEKSKIAEVVYEKVTKINRIYLNPTNCRPAPGVLEAIKEADCIIIGPGSLYTNVIPNLLVPGVSKAIKESSGFKIYVSNIMTEYGQTDNYTLHDHIKAIIDHAGKGIVDYCIYDTGEIVPEYIRQYNKEGSELVEQDIAKVKEEGIKLIQRNLSTVENGRIRHNPDAIATSIVQLICDDLKFRDMQNDTQFIMLDSKIKDTKKKMKNNKKKNVKKKDTKKHSNSKFFEKYNDRIQSIQESANKKPEHMKTKQNANQKVDQKEEKSVEKSKEDDKDRAKRMEDTLKKEKRK